MIKIKDIKPDKLVDIVTNFLIIVLGITILASSVNRIENNIDFMANFYYFLTIVYIISYFLYRKYHNYEKLFLSLASAIVMALLYFLRDSNSVILLGTSLFLYSILVVTIKSISMIAIKKRKKQGCQSKIICTLFIAFTGFLTGYILISQVLSQVLIYGHFFIIFGIICLFEPVLCIVSKEQ